jgi:hypothetical protein
MSTISYDHQDRLQVAQIAAALAITGFIALAVFQVALASGAQLGHAAWGGASTNLTSGQRIGSAVSVLIYAAAASVVLARLGLSRRPRSQPLLKWFPWFLVVVFAISAFANFASQSHWENYLLGPVSVALAVLCLIVAQCPMPSR